MEVEKSLIPLTDPWGRFDSNNHDNVPSKWRDIPHVKCEYSWALSDPNMDVHRYIWILDSLDLGATHSLLMPKWKSLT